MIKLMIIGRRRSGITRNEMQQHMLDIHAPLVLEFIAAHPDQAPQRYAQNHFIDSTHAAGAPEDNPWALDRDFVTQVWAESAPGAMAALALPFYKEKLRPDEDNFVDQATVIKLMAREELVFCDQRRTARYKLFFVLPAGAEGKPLAELFSGLIKRVVADHRAPYIPRHVRNLVMTPPGTPPVAELVEEFWLDSLEDCNKLLGLLRESLASDESGPEIGNAMQGGLAGVAVEHVLHKGVD